MKDLNNLLIKINKEFSSGDIINKNTLEWLNDYINHNKIPFITQISYVLRALLTNHIFYDGNKRTALYFSLLYFKKMNLYVNEDELFETITKISKKNINDIKEIKRLLKRCYRL